tara:strand:- start:285 stop:635 length:351 start_codon:yes stop_codon:yes gene_type:complete
MYKNKKTDKSTKKEKKIILEKSNKKDKRFKVTMKNFPNMEDHSHHFGSKGGKSYIDSRTDQEKKNWFSRHKDDKGFNNIHSGIYYSKNLLWGDNKSLKKNIKDLEKKLNAKIIYKS